MNNELSISIVIPVYNEQRYIKACLDAIAAQTVQPLEAIVVDNNSSDKTLEIAKSYPFVRVVKEQKQGIVYARTAGFDAAKGDIIARIDADTVLPKGWLKKVSNFYKDGAHHDYALTGGGYFYNVRLPRFNGWVQSQFAYRINRFVTGHYILWGSNMAIPKHIWQKVRGDLCMRTDMHEDMDLAIHTVKAGYKIRYEAKKLRVGVSLRRVFADREKLHAHMQRWPKTLRQHGYKLWWMGTLGNVLLWYIFQPIVFITDYIAKFFRKPELN